MISEALYRAYCGIGKSIAIPGKYQFAVSDKSFGIRAKKRPKSMIQEEARRIMALSEREVSRASERREIIVNVLQFPIKNRKSVSEQGI